jgi:hypothetical protein
MPNNGSLAGKKKFQAWLLPELVAQLDVVCEQAGRISRAQALTAAWPAMLIALRELYHLDETTR